ncbi:Uncharacterised protein [Serratia rubidaea]|uniref:Uncharacterized protein n=1 Tax=Serratia rubidaea TaxID=61652 RepID=A0A448SE09_SERRU|nr:Uncharacterised protein [Serratia rubidaea]
MKKAPQRRLQTSDAPPHRSLTTAGGISATAPARQIKQLYSMTKVFRFSVLEIISVMLLIPRYADFPLRSRICRPAVAPQCQNVEQPASEAVSLLIRSMGDDRHPSVKKAIPVRSITRRKSELLFYLQKEKNIYFIWQGSQNRVGNMPILPSAGRAFFLPLHAHVCNTKKTTYGHRIAHGNRHRNSATLSMSCITAAIVIRRNSLRHSVSD